MIFKANPIDLTKYYIKSLIKNNAIDQYFNLFLLYNLTVLLFASQLSLIKLNIFVLQFCHKNINITSVSLWQTCSIVCNIVLRVSLLLARLEVRILYINILMPLTYKCVVSRKLKKGKLIAAKTIRKLCNLLEICIKLLVWQSRGFTARKTTRNQKALVVSLKSNALNYCFTNIYIRERLPHYKRRLDSTITLHPLHLSTVKHSKTVLLKFTASAGGVYCLCTHVWK